LSSAKPNLNPGFFKQAKKLRTYNVERKRLAQAGTSICSKDAFHSHRGIYVSVRASNLPVFSGTFQGGHMLKCFRMDAVPDRHDIFGLARANSFRALYADFAVFDTCLIFDT